MDCNILFNLYFIHFIFYFIINFYATHLAMVTLGVIEV